MLWTSTTHPSDKDFDHDHTSQVPLNGHTARVDLQTPMGIPLNSRRHGKGRVPSQTAAAFDLSAFSRALEQHDVDYQVAHYAPDADIRIVDPDNPSAVPRSLSGQPAIHAWMIDSITHDLDLDVTQVGLTGPDDERCDPPRPPRARSGRPRRRSPRRLCPAARHQSAGRAARPRRRPRSRGR